MHLFQQEEYENGRFIKYISKKFKFIDKRLTLAILLSLLTLLLTKDIGIHLSLLSALFLTSTFLHVDPCKRAKKVLVCTQRVKRIFAVFYLIFIVIFATAFYKVCFHKNPTTLYLTSILLVQIIPFVIVLANLCLQPFENRVRRKFLLEARGKILDFKPIVIGITGSYGKTSTKHILAHIMSSVVPTLVTPGSVNTEMGITRVIREKLMPEHKYFIVEMGAYQLGSIANRCELTPPTHGIITSVGNAHHERFGSEANVAKTKFELAQAVLKEGIGKLIINVDAVNKKYIDRYCKKCEKNLIKVSTNKEKGDYIISEEKITKNGIEFNITINDKSFKVKAPIYGKHQISNTALSFALAYNIGISPESIIASLGSVTQVKHRLETTKTPAGHILIDDAYNSNPTGFKSALGTLKLLRQTNGRTILVTPGMAELGKLHDDEHFKIGEVVGKFVDIVLVVVPERIPTFIKGFKVTAKLSQILLEFASFCEAKEWLDKNIKPNDTILYENDLPDLYETQVKI